MENYWFNQYRDYLVNFVNNNNESDLYKTQQLIREMLEHSISPEELVNLHIDVLGSIFPDMDEKIKASYAFLLEAMMGYGLAYQEHQSLRSKQLQLESEIEVAANVQQSLLIGEVPENSPLEIGVVSQPAKQMSGDYYHFVLDEHNCLGVAVADIIGKGIPAALCMSMIKYAMDSVPEQRDEPATVLKSLNRVVEQNVDASMFVTMFYGIYDPRVERFFFSSAGHEPGFFYCKATDSFEEMAADGVVLGLSQQTKYTESSRAINEGDMIILLSDGVTECRTEDGFVEREEILQLIRDNMHLSVGDIAENVYRKMERAQNFELRDDFTLIIMKKPELSLV